jgi:uncharacterized alkaline shock family protein YloU
MEAPLISAEVLARYAGDAAQEVDGVSGLARDAAVTRTNGTADVVVHVELAWGSSAEAVGRSVQERVAEYVGQMSELDVRAVDVVVEQVGAPPAKQ